MSQKYVLYQEKGLLVYKCLRCHYKNRSACVMKIHVDAHQYDAKYMQRPGDETQGIDRFFIHLLNKK